jgi:hypothetical protein
MSERLNIRRFELEHQQPFFWILAALLIKPIRRTEHRPIVLGVAEMNWIQRSHGLRPARWVTGAFCKGFSSVIFEAAADSFRLTVGFVEATRIAQLSVTAS